MPIKPDRTYDGAVKDGARWVVSRKKGTNGLQIFLHCEDGDTDYTLWFTPGRREQLEQEFDALGISADQRMSRSYLQYQLAADIAGREVAFGTKTEEFQGRETTKVGWIGGHRAADEGAIAETVAGFFGAVSKSASSDGDGFRSGEDDDF